MLVQDPITEAFEEIEIPPTFRKFAGTQLCIEAIFRQDGARGGKVFNWTN